MTPSGLARYITDCAIFSERICYHLDARTLVASMSASIKYSFPASVVSMNSRAQGGTHRRRASVPRRNVASFAFGMDPDACTHNQQKLERDELEYIRESSV